MGEVRVDTIIEASPEAVWEVLSDIGGWGDWNDVMIDGRCDRGEVGAVLSFRVRVGPIMLPIRARLTSWSPGRALVWGEDRGRILRIFHGFELSAVDGGTCVVHSETFRGLIGRLVYQVAWRALEPNYARFLDALKQRVEG